MGKHQFKKLGPRNIREVCVSCNKNLQKRIGSTNLYKPICSQCDKRRYGYKYKNRVQVKGYRKYKTNICSMCSFTSDYSCQFDVDHIDGNHQNDNVTNLQTLCANCHRLKTYINKDWK